MTTSDYLLLMPTIANDSLSSILRDDQILTLFDASIATLQAGKIQFQAEIAARSAPAPVPAPAPAVPPATTDPNAGNAPPAPPPPPSQSASPDGTRGATITDTTGAVWSIGPNNGTMKDGVVQGSGCGTEYVLSGGVVYTRGCDSAWWKWDGAAWSLFGQAPPATTVSIATK